MTKKDYSEGCHTHLLTDIDSILQQGLSKAYKAVDNQYRIKAQDSADHGEKLIEMLAVDLTFSRATIFSIVAFYRIFPICRDN